MDALRSSTLTYAGLFEHVADELAEVTSADEDWCEDCEMCAWTHETLAGIRRRLLAASAVLVQHAAER